MEIYSEKVLINIRKIIRAIELHSRKIQSMIELTGPQLVVLKEVAKIGSTSVGNLAEKTSLSQPTVSALVKKLIAKELLIKSSSTIDKRASRLELTAKGINLLNIAPGLLQDSFLKRFNSLPEWEILMILSSLEKLVEMMQADDINADPVLSTEVNVDSEKV